MRTRHPASPHFLDSVPRAAAVAALALVAALAAGCQDDEPAGRTVASDRTTESREMPPPTPDYRKVTARPQAEGRDSADGPDRPEAGPDSLPDPVTYARAESVYRSDDHERALRLFEAYRERRPENPWGLYMLGLSARKAERPARAEEAFRAVLEKDPDHVKSRVNLARTLLDLDRPEEAVRALRPVLRSDGPPADAFRVAGNAAWEAGERERARRLYRAAISRDGGDAWSMNNLGLLHIRAGRYEEALAPLARALELRPDRPVIRNNLGVALERTGRPALAGEHYRAAAEAGHPKAGASLTRVEALGADSAGTRLDLAALAHDFAVEAEGWSATLALEPREDADTSAGGPAESPGDAGTEDGDPRDGDDEPGGGDPGGDGGPPDAGGGDRGGPLLR